MLRRIKLMSAQRQEQTFGPIQNADIPVQGSTDWNPGALFS
jgi:hypothetical protein